MIFGMLHNTKTGRFHPIVFRQAPMPSGVDTDFGMMRHKSKGHHTDGFDTIEAAQEYVVTSCASGEHTDSGCRYEWDGEDIPAMVEWFPNPAPASGDPP
jgi:hypothetical protein